MTVVDEVGGPIPAIGTVLRGTYRIVRAIAEGGCGDVYVATHARLGSDVAVKILHPSVAGVAPVMARLRKEADIMSALRHPHIVQILDFNVTEWGVPFLVMEFLEGRLLSEEMIPARPFSPRATVRIVDQIAQALQAVHAHGIVHLDLKPANVVLLSIDGRDDFVKVIDFGISRASWSARLSDEPLITGTPEYMAPEQASGSTEGIDHRADQFSLAAVAYTLLTGHEPFRAHDPGALLYQVMNQVQQPPSELAPWLGPGVNAVIAQGMSKQAADRYPDILSFAEALHAAIDALGGDRRLARSGASTGDWPPTPSAEGSKLLAPPSERDTMKFIRKPRVKIRARRSGRVLLALAAAAAFAWFAPPTRRTTRALWHRASAEAGSAIRRGPALLGARRASAASPSTSR